MSPLTPSLYLAKVSARSYSNFAFWYWEKVLIFIKRGEEVKKGASEDSSIE